MRINVAYGADEGFTKHVYVSLFSILINMQNKDDLHCYFITESSNKYVSIIKRLEKMFKNFKLDTISINEMDVDKIQTSGELPYLNSATYYRLCINLIEGVDKIIYLDSDIIVNSDISLLFQENLDKKIVGVCSETPANFVSSHISELGLKKRMYFNAGMMVINLKKRKEYQVSNKCVKLLKERIYKFNDQDVLNIVLQYACKWFPGDYNVLTGYFSEHFGNFSYMGFEREYYENATKNPKIIHYTGNGKPRKLLARHPLRYVYGKMFLKSMTVGVINDGYFLRELFIAIIHNIEDFLFDYNIQKKVRQYYWSCYFYFKDKVKNKAFFKRKKDK